MPIPDPSLQVVQCPGCRRNLKVRAKAATVKGKCPACGTAVVLGPAAKESEVVEEVVDLEAAGVPSNPTEIVTSADRKPPTDVSQSANVAGHKAPTSNPETAAKENPQAWLLVLAVVALLFLGFAFCVAVLQGRFLKAGSHPSGAMFWSVIYGGCLVAGPIGLVATAAWIWIGVKALREAKQQRSSRSQRGQREDVQGAIFFFLVAAVAFLFCEGLFAFACWTLPFMLRPK